MKITKITPIFILITQLLLGNSGVYTRLDIERAKINIIDTEIINLLDQRSKVSLAIGGYKRKRNLAVYVPSREKVILDRLSKKSKLLPKESIISIYKSIFKASRDLQID